MKRHFALASLALVAGLLLVTGGAPVFSQAAGPSAPNSPPTGVLVASVVPGGPADKAGIRRGDIILSVGGADVNTPRDVAQSIAAVTPGNAVDIKLSHGDSVRTVSLTPENQDGRLVVGIGLVPSVAGGFRDRMGPWPQERSGAIVTEIAPSSPAAKAGLQPRELILSVDGTAVDAQHSLSDLIGQHKIGDVVKLSVLSRDRQARDVSVTLESNPSNQGSPYLGVQYFMVPARAERAPGARDRGYGDRIPGSQSSLSL